MIRRSVAVAVAVAVAVSAAVLLGGCAGAPVVDQARQPMVSTSSDPTTATTPTPGVARLARPARSQRVRFVPDRVVLPGGAAAAVESADTVDGVLQVPKDVRRIGWWTGSAYAGDPFGAMVLAGHVDSADQGIGFFARLMKIKKGEQVTVTADGHRATYRVRSVGLVAKDALAADGVALDQTGKHRLVLITCGGRYLPDRGGYQSNLVVVAEPVGTTR